MELFGTSVCSAEKDVSLQKARCLLNDTSKMLFEAHKGFCIIKRQPKKYVFSNQLSILVLVLKILQENLKTLQWTDISLWCLLASIQGRSSSEQPMSDKKQG